ncbi:cell division protein [Alteriqipengyuania flavescens]|uniref:cell division protein FtsX n=1 Tax=Alteriqipengyuania flavescens TaxID=3053610 RepID=UPI0025B4FB17|nr:cell division protein [Alteriqipengyuania flavescens]WJY19286.1 cell division protein [Alteriqipengyuania flavescens]WJY25227.1 cell division protein [Alteriqipengyuania flavescens]
MKPPPARRFARLRGLSPFRGDRAAEIVPHARLSGPMPWVMAIMIALTSVAAAGGLSLSSLASGARAELDGGLTVQVMEANPAARDRKAEQAVSFLSNQSGVIAAQRVPQDELATLLEPWLGEMGGDGGAEEAAIPIPALIDAQLDGAASPERLERLSEALSAAVPGATVNTQSSWLEPVFGAIASLQWLSLGLVVLLSLATVAAVWLAARSALGGSRDTVEIVHLLGGTDRQIAGVFQRSIAYDAMLGGAVGLAIGMGAILVLGSQFSTLNSGLIAESSLGLGEWLLIAAIPLVGVALAALTARVTILLALRKML